ncbi:hypothetical protein B7463_g2321, partial [Scytalidium lignicola]
MGGVTHFEGNSVETLQFDGYEAHVTTFLDVNDAHGDASQGSIGLFNTLSEFTQQNLCVLEPSNTRILTEERCELVDGETVTQMNGEGVSDSATTTEEQSTNYGGSVNGMNPSQCEIAKQTRDVHTAEAIEIESSKIGHCFYAKSCPLCSREFNYLGELNLHVKKEHVELLRCNQCGYKADGCDFKWWSKAVNHANTTSHLAFLCPDLECTMAFSRADVLRRHYMTKHEANAARYPCPHCKKYKGSSSFKRKDHLVQHLQGYHNFKVSNAEGVGKSCPHFDCEAYRGAGIFDFITSHAFKKQSEYTAHMRKVHDESLFPCTVSGCKRVGGKGFFREKDFLKHMASIHQENAE